MAIHQCQRPTDVATSSESLSDCVQFNFVLLPQQGAGRIHPAATTGSRYDLGM